MTQNQKSISNNFHRKRTMYVGFALSLHPLLVRPIFVLSSPSFFLSVTSPGRPVFAWLNKETSQTSATPVGLLS